MFRKLLRIIVVAIQATFMAILAGMLMAFINAPTFFGLVLITSSAIFGVKVMAMVTFIVAVAVMAVAIFRKKAECVEVPNATDTTSTGQPTT